MYSLYRAWFGGEETYPRFETLSPPDTLVRVGNEGEHQFVAHRGVLAAHSGYLKALLATATNSTTNPGRDDATSTVTSVSVSSVGGEAFAPLLNYMYTGRLDVTLENIYSVLLATHLLHMPGALEQCRAALLRLRGPPPPLPATSSVTRPGTILRPVPNRLVGPPLCWSQPTLYPPGHVGLSHLPNFQLSSGLSILPNSGILQESTTIPYSFRENTPSPPSVAIELRRHQNPEVRVQSPCLPSTSCQATSTEDKVTAKELDGGNKRENDPTFVNVSLPSPDECNERLSLTNNEQTNNRRNNVESPRSRIDPVETASTSSGTGVIYDIACCDGPVRFHRVLNENYVSNGQTPTTTSQQRSKTSCASEEDVEVEVAEIRENDENGKPEGTSAVQDTQTESSTSNNGSYTCGYCRHTFKSHYCYRKHARRHLLPSTETEGASGVNPGNNHNDGRRREVKLLDLNVQYYPCKICGSKFPSYYFVHKHKKLCHANVEENSAGIGDSETSSIVAQGNTSDP